MESQDLWLQVKMKMENSDTGFLSEFDIKVDCNTDGKSLKRLVQKTAITIWNDLITIEDLDKLNNRFSED